MIEKEKGNPGPPALWIQQSAGRGRKEKWFPGQRSGSDGTGRVVALVALTFDWLFGTPCVGPITLAAGRPIRSGKAWRGTLERQPCFAGATRMMAVLIKSNAPSVAACGPQRDIPASRPRSSFPAGIFIEDKKLEIRDDM
jgi:hypothetical protein